MFEYMKIFLIHIYAIYTNTLTHFFNLLILETKAYKYAMRNSTVSAYYFYGMDSAFNKILKIMRPAKDGQLIT